MEQIKATLDIKAAAEYAGIHEGKIRELVHTQDFPCFKNGRKWLINRELLDEWLKKTGIFPRGIVGKRRKESDQNCNA